MPKQERPSPRIYAPEGADRNSNYDATTYEHQLARGIDG
jgi:hypothetical protein